MVEQTDRLLLNLLVRYASEAHRDPTTIGQSTPVFGPDGIIDESIAVLDALCAIEECFGINIPDEDLTEELFDSYKNLHDYVVRRVAQTPSLEPHGEDDPPPSQTQLN